MHHSYITSIINIVVMGVHVFMQLAAAVLIFIKHKNPKDRSKWFIFSFFLMSALAAMGELVITLQAGNFLDSFRLLDPGTLISGYFNFSLLMWYLVEVLRPNWLSWKRIVPMMIPWGIALVSFIIFWQIDGVTRIYSISKLSTVWTEPNVLARLALAAAMFPYAVWIASLCCRNHQQMSYRPYIRAIIIITILMTITYFCSRGLQFFWAYMAHEVFYLVITVLILYVEHYERLHIPYESVRMYYTPSVETIPTTTDNTIKSVAVTICDIMEDPEVWQNPDITRDEIVHLVGTNRTYIQAAAKHMGFESITDMLHKRRVEYICQRLREDPATNMQELFYDAGYRSRTTGWRRFTTIVGCTPTEFVEKNTTPPQPKIKTD